MFGRQLGPVGCGLSFQQRGSSVQDPNKQLPSNKEGLRGAPSLQSTRLGLGCFGPSPLGSRAESAVRMS